MSINSNMKQLILQVNEEVITPSLARKKEWVDKEPILISIYETDSRVTTNNARYGESSHLGLTFNKSVLASKNRLKDGDTIYQINGVVPQGRLNQLFLKVIENV